VRNQGDVARVEDLPEILLAAFERLPVGILVIDAEGTIVMANAEIERLFGWSQPELLGQSIDALVPNSTNQAALRDALSRPLRARVVNAGRDAFGRRKDGSEVPVEVTFTPLRMTAGEFALVSVLDLTDRRKTQADLQRRLEEASDLDALTREIATEFIDLPADDVDRRVQDALGRLGRALGVDHCVIFRLAQDKGDFARTHNWTRPGWAPFAARVPLERFPWHVTQLRTGDVVSFDTVDDVPDAVDRDSLREMGVLSGVTLPLLAADRTWGGISIAAVGRARVWTPAIVIRLRSIAVAFAHTLARQHADLALRSDVAATTARLDALRDENAHLRHELNALTGAPSIVAHSGAMRRVLEQVRQVARGDDTVLLRGERGTGKALLARRIHELSARNERPLLHVGCALLSAGSIEIDLLGTTAAPVHAAPGAARLTVAHGATLCLEEAAQLSLDAQASLNRLLETMTPSRPGSARRRPDVRIIVSTQVDLARAVAAGTFRSDLYQRLNALAIHVAPLRERREDIPPLVWRFVDEFTDRYGKVVEAIDRESMLALQRYRWPGNASELRTVVERAVLLLQGRQLRIPRPEPRTAGRGSRR
jgi:PAS domain S-box-containing protein